MSTLEMEWWSADGLHYNENGQKHQCELKERLARMITLMGKVTKSIQRELEKKIESQFEIAFEILINIFIA